MTRVSYTATVLKYVHDAVAGEALNIGVALLAPSQRFAGVKVQERYERLSNAFEGFDGESYRRVLRSLQSVIGDQAQHWKQSLPSMDDMPRSAHGLIRIAWPDAALSFQWGESIAGVTSDPEKELSHLFQRLVIDQAHHPVDHHRDDEQVWNLFREPLAKTKSLQVLKAKRVETSDLDITFDHAFRNGAWHALVPISFDLMKAGSIQDKAARWLGHGVALHGSGEMDKLYLLLGRPEIEENNEAYTRAKNILNKIPLEHEFVEEGEAETFAQSLEADLERFGLLKSH